MLGLGGYGTSDSEDEGAGSGGAAIARTAPAPVPVPTARAAPCADVSVAAVASSAVASSAVATRAIVFDRRIAPRGAGGCSSKTIARVAALRDRDGNFTESLRRNKKFGNPYLLSQVVEHFKIDETGSKFEHAVAYGAERFVDALRAERRAAEANAHLPSPALPPAQTQALPPAQTQAPGAAAVAAVAAAAAVATVAPPVEGPAPPPAKKRRKSRWS